MDAVVWARIEEKNSCLGPVGERIGERRGILGMVPVEGGKYTTGTEKGRGGGPKGRGRGGHPYKRWKRGKNKKRKGGEVQKTPRMRTPGTDLGGIYENPTAQGKGANEHRQSKTKRGRKGGESFWEGNDKECFLEVATP